MMWIKWVLLLTVCQHTLCISQPYRLVDKNTTCLEIKVESRLSCINQHQFYHCLLDENYTKEFEVCRDWKWIPGGKCAYLNSYGIGNIDERDCASSSTLHCATDQYRSDLNTQYSACYVKKRIVITTPIVTVTVRPTGSGTSDVRNTAETAPTESAPPESQFNGSAIGLAFAVILLLILLAVIRILFKKRGHTQDTSKRETSVENGECEALVSTETKYLEENEEKHLPIENDARTTTEDEESSSLLARNKNKNQNEGNEKDTRKGITVTEGIFVDSLEFITKEDNENEEYTTRETTDNGRFIDSLESIIKTDYEEGGCIELQDLLEYVCTRPARKIMFNVVKMYVNNPDSYFQDESKKGLVKSVLPQEYHSALDHESEYRHSIPVIYAILQLSLSEEHQPKSGWGQRVKDTDTGVGDDVERMYKVHTLSREIQNPEAISVEGYGRLFEMFIGAIERLDIKGKYSEDYKEIVRRWETIQRKQWMKDKWNTFTNFIKEWS